MKIVVLLMVFISHWAVAEEVIGLGKLRVDMMVSDVISQLGEPISKVEQADFITDIYSYSNVEAHFSGKYLVGIYTESSEVCTPQGICPGSELKSIIAVYGKAFQKSKNILEFYPEQAYTCWYRVQINSEIIKSLEVVCQP